MEEDEIIEGAVATDTEGTEETQTQQEGEEDTTDYKKKYEEQKKANIQILARAKKAEEKSKSKPQVNSTDPDLVDELKLIARGISDEEIEQARVVAKGKGITLTEAIKDPLFISFQKELKEKERKEDARLGVSRGSAETAEESAIKPNMTREEHEAAFKKVMGQQ